MIPSASYDNPHRIQHAILSSLKTSIYYFSGTGNSLATARDIAQLLPAATVYSIPLLMDREVVDDADIVGFVFPVYFFDMPPIVKEFVKKIQYRNHPYIFGITTCGAGAGHTLFSLASIVTQNGKKLEAGFVLVMPENYIGPISLMETREVQHTKIEQVKQKIPYIADSIKERQSFGPEGKNSVFTRIGGGITGTLMGSVYNTKKRLLATDKCSRCGICQMICPTANISVTETGVSWNNTCTQCYACIHWCPESAIEIGGRTAGKQRYHHPDVRIADMIL